MTKNSNRSLSKQFISRQELQKLIRTQLRMLLEVGNLEGAKTVLVPAQPVDIADAIEDLPQAMQAIAFRLLSKDEAIEVYEYLSPPVQHLLIEDLKRQDVLDIVDKMPPDARAKLFDELPAKVVRHLLTQLSQEEREATALLLGYKPNTAGRIMTPEYISLKEGWTITQAFECIRRLAPTSETIYSLYVTDTVHRLRGCLSLRSLVTAQPEQLVGDIMDRHPICVHTDTDQEEVARVLGRYDFLALAVVDAEERLVGIVTVDDVIDILHQETTEDIHALAGVQSGGDRYFHSPFHSIIRRRALWLIVVFILSSFAGLIIQAQEKTLEQIIILAAFIPLLIDTGGDVGSQSSTVMIRGLNTEQIRSHGVFWAMGREAKAGVLLGLILGLAATVWAYFFQGNLLIAVVVGISLLFICVLSAVVGTGLPFLFSFLGLDPALMSAPFITTISDVLGVLIYFYVAKLILRL